MRWVETTTTVRFNEVDQWGIAWHGHYFAWFELARMKVLEKFSLLPEEFTALGFIAPVVSAHCEFKKKRPYQRSHNHSSPRAKAANRIPDVSIRNPETNR